MAYDIFVNVDTDVTEKDISLIRSQVSECSGDSRVSFIRMKDNDFAGAHIERYLTKATYFRLLIPWLIPQYSKIIYADVDIIFNSSLKDLYDLNLGTNYIAGINKPKYQRGGMGKYLRKINLDPKDYVNAGFIIINSGLWRENNLNEKFMKMISTTYRFMEQDILNTICQGRILHLDNKWNMTPREVMEEGIGDPKVLHYIWEKPWDTFTCCWKEWWDNYRLSVCFDQDFYYSKNTEIINSIEKLKEKETLLEKRPIKILNNFLGIIYAIKKKVRNLTNKNT